MQAEHALYSYNYLYRISNNPAFIHKMVTLFINSVTEYRNDLQQLQVTCVLHDLKRTVHKLKPSVLSMEVTGAKELILKLEEATEWNGDVETVLMELISIFERIKPMMEQDLKELPL